MLISELEAKLKELREKHGDLLVGSYHPMAKKWVALDAKGIGLVSKDEHDLFSMALSSDLKYECDFIGIAF